MSKLSEELRRVKRNARQREWYAKNREKWNAYKRRWSAENPDSVRESNKKWADANRESNLARRRERYWEKKRKQENGD